MECVSGMGISAAKGQVAATSCAEGSACRDKLLENFRLPRKMVEEIESDAMHDLAWGI
jgi:hypothetical protein